MIALSPSADASHVVEKLQDAARDLGNVETGTADPLERLNGWRTWVAASTRTLRPVLETAALRQHVQGEHFELLQTVHPGTHGTHLHLLIDTEIRTRIEDLTVQARLLQEAVRLWSPCGKEIAAILDTNVLVDFGRRLQLVNWHHVLNQRPNVPVSIVIPIQVVEELDGLKDRGTQDTKKAARDVLRWLDEMFPDQYQDQVLDQGPVFPPRRVTIRLLVDDLHRHPLPRVDADIIDRALALRPLTADVVVISQDRSMRFRSRAAELTAQGLRHVDVPAEPG